jgi:very-short-patch-repair endonuclease
MAKNHINCLYLKEEKKIFLCMEKNFHYNKKFKGLARKLRKNSTTSEIKMWSELLRGGNLMGYEFLRQRPVGNFIVDFMCKKLKLVIELDGFTHIHGFVNDDVKDRCLKDLGFNIIRFSDDDVFFDLENVRRVLENYVADWESSMSSPQPPSPPARPWLKGE